MPTPTSFIPGPVHVRRKRRQAVPAQPPATGQITMVKHGDAAEQLYVFLSEPLASHGDFHAMLTASVSGELWLLPISINTDDPTLLIFTMNGDVSTTTMWRVPAPGRANYHFAGGGSLAEPFQGEVQ